MAINSGIKQTKKLQEVLAATSLENTLIISEEGYIQFQSESILQNYGYEPGSMINKSIFSYIKQKDQLYVAQALQNLLSKEINEIKGDTTMRDASDRKRYIYYVARRFNRHIIWSFFDVTSMKKKHKQQLEAVYIDDLTQIPNIKGFERYVTNLMKRHNEQPFTVFKIEIGRAHV